MTNHSDEVQTRIQKLNRIRALGINPFANKFATSSSIAEVNTIGSAGLRSVEEIIPNPVPTVHIAGRVMLHRSFGKICFATLSDGTGKIQIMFSRENCSIQMDGQEKQELKNDTESVSAYKFAEKLVDLGDFIGVSGELFFTHKGERTLFVQNFTFLTKAIRPLPEKWHGIENDEERFRKRYLDMATNEELREMFYRKSKFWEVTRNFLKDKWFLEVETPTIEHTTGGAEARPFATHHNDYDVDVYMRICVGELWQKRLMAGGFPKTFEIGRAYRNEGSSPEHLQEFTNMEFYWAYANYEDGMRLVQEMYQTIAMEVYGRTAFTAKGHEFDLAGEWPKVDYLEAVENKTGINLLTATDEEMRTKLQELGVKYEWDNRERLTDTLWKYVRKTITGPVFLINHPQIISPLAKASAEYPGRVERFQPIIAGSEVGNGFSELNDPLDQRARFEAQQELLKSGDDEAMMPEWDFVEMLEHGMPPTCGFGFGERFFAFLEDKPLRECQYFPFMRPEKKEVSTKIIKETKVAIVILNQKARLEKWQEMNTIGHLCASFGARNEGNLFFQDIATTADQQDIKMNIQHAIVIKSSPDGENIVSLLNEAKSRWLEIAEFTREMIAWYDKAVLEVTKTKAHKDIEYLGVLVFGNKKEVEELTKGFSLLS